MSDPKPTDQLSTVEAAALAGLTPGSFRTYLRDGMMVEPDGRLGRVPWWYRSTIENWKAETDQRKAERNAKRAEDKVARDAEKAEQKKAREEAKAAREAEKAEKAKAREEAKAAREAEKAAKAEAKAKADAVKAQEAAKAAKPATAAKKTAATAE